MEINEFIKKTDTDNHYKNKFYSVLLFEKGKGNVMIDDREFEINPHKFFFLNYNQVYHFKNPEFCKGYVLMFTKSFYNYIYTGNELIKSDSVFSDVSPYITPSDWDKNGLWETFEEIKKEYGSNKKLLKEIICLLLKVFMLKYIRSSEKNIYPERSTDHKKELIEKFSELVDIHFKELKTPSMYAEKLNITPNYLNALVKENSDITAGKMIKNRVILEAERLLLHTSLSITEISYELGFSDNSHFGKYFKSEKNVSPNSYRMMKTDDDLK